MCIMGTDKNGRFLRGSLDKIVRTFKVGKRAVQRLWKQCPSALLRGIIKHTEVRSRKFLCGVKARYPDDEELGEAIKKIPLLKRRSYRKLAKSLGVSHTKVAQWIATGKIRSCNSQVKPYLTDENRLKRVLYALEWRDERDRSRYRDMMNVIHVDEKWFYITRINETFYLSEDEPDPSRFVANKLHIKKVSSVLIAFSIC